MNVTFVHKHLFSNRKNTHQLLNVSFVLMLKCLKSFLWNWLCYVKKYLVSHYHKLNPNICSESKIKGDSFSCKYHIRIYTHISSLLGANLVSPYFSNFFFHKSFLLVTLYICLWVLHIFNQFTKKKKDSLNSSLWWSVLCTWTSFILMQCYFYWCNIAINHSYLVSNEGKKLIGCF